MHRAKPRVSPPDRRLVDALLRPEAFDHAVASIELIETHISWVILADDYAYKIKKPIVLDFLDFGTLERRRFFCEEELRLNQPAAPDIYVDVVAITDDDGDIRFAGDGQPIEYAVRMRRFDQGLRLDAQLTDGKLDTADMKELGNVIATRHAAAPRVEAAKREHQVATTKDFIWDNFDALDTTVQPQKLQRLRDWTRNELSKVDALLGQRFDDGYVRDCHGDLHLANLVRLPDGISTFDCIEFDSNLREIDVICDVAFLTMDLVAHDRHDLASHFLNRYLETSGDYAGVELLDLFFVYRCLVRAKVEAISSMECDEDRQRDMHLAEVERYCGMAERQASKSRPVLIVMHGLSGSGKTWLSTQLMAALPAIRIRSDIERKRLSGLGEHESSESGIRAGLYTTESSAEVYSRITALARHVLTAGHNVIIDAAFLQMDQRKNALLVADSCKCAGLLLHVEAPVDLMRKRIDERQAAADDPSEASQSVLSDQLERYEKIGPEEQSRTIVCDNAGAVDIESIVRSIRSRQRQQEDATAYGTYD